MTHSHLFQEIEEDLQRKKYEELWQRFGKYILGFAVLLVLGTAAISGWRTHRTNLEQAATLDYMRRLDAKDVDAEKKAASLLDFAQKMRGETIASLAQLQAAAILAKADKLDKALAAYDALAKDAKADVNFRDLADLLWVQVQLDKGDAPVLLARLQPLLETSLWKNLAQEYAALLALRTGDKAKAKQIYSALAQDAADAPHGVVVNAPNGAARAKDILRWLEQGY